MAGEDGVGQVIEALAAAPAFVALMVRPVSSRPFLRTESEEQ